MAMRHGRSVCRRLRCEPLEPRDTPAAVTVIDFAGGFTEAGLPGGLTAGYADGDLLLTDGPHQSRAAWTPNRVHVGRFQTSFVFRLEGEPGRLGDGFTFALRGTGSSGFAKGGAGLGYQGLTNSVAVKFDLVGNAGEGAQSVGVFTGGAEPTMPAVTLDGSPIHLHSQHPIRADLAYDGTVLTVTLTDTTAPDQAWTHAFPVDIPGAVRWPTAQAGFTAGTGELFARQAIESWTFAEVVPDAPTSQPPTITFPARVDYGPGENVFLAVGATDDGGPHGLTYTWETVSAPAGASPSWSVGDDDSLGRATAHLDAYGTYTFRVTVRDGDGQAVTSEVTHGYAPSISRIEIVPEQATIPVGGTVQFTAIGYDSFGRRLPGPVNPGWRVFFNLGTIDSTGLYRAPPGLSGRVTIHAGGGPPESPLAPWDEASVVIESAIPPGGDLDFRNGFAGAELAANGSARVADDRLRLADGPYQAGSAFAPEPVDVRGFASRFRFQVGDAPDGRLGDGLTFVLQNAGPNAVGRAGGGLGYEGISSSVAIKFDLVDNAGEGTDSVGVFTGGAEPTVPAERPVSAYGGEVHLHSGHVFQADLTYVAGKLTVGLRDTVTGAWYSRQAAVDLPAAVGGTHAYAGFTAGTGELFAPIDVLTWTYVPTDDFDPSRFLI